MQMVLKQDTLWKLCNDLTNTSNKLETNVCLFSVSLPPLPLSPSLSISFFHSNSFACYFLKKVLTLEEKLDQSVSKCNKLEARVSELENAKLCPVCLSKPKDVVLSCRHTVCMSCVGSILNVDGPANINKIRCPMCRELVTKDDVKSFII